MNVVIYSRVSSQSARQSTERQVVDLERFAAGRGYEVTAVFEEKISGRKANIERPVLAVAWNTAQIRRTGWICCC